MTFENAIISLIFDDGLTKDELVKLLSNEKIKIPLPIIFYNPNPLPSLTLTYDDISISVYNARFQEKTKTIFQTSFSNVDLDKIGNTIFKLVEIGKSVSTPFSIETNLSYVVDHELKRTTENPFKSRVGYIFIDFSEYKDLRQLDYLLDVRILPYPADPRKTLVQLIYRDRKIEISKIIEIMNKIDKFIRSD